MRIKRKLKVCILSDIHLGAYGCHAQELLSYLKSIQPELLILNGDIIDIWNFRKKYFPASHMKVIGRIMKMAQKGVKVVYVTGNHDELLRQYSDLEIGNVKLVDKYFFKMHGKNYWVFHGDVFDRTTSGNAKVIAKLGGKGYDLLIVFNRFVNQLMEFFGKEKLSFSRKVKYNVKRAVRWIANFETTAAELAIDQKIDYVVCGHIHQPKIEKVQTLNGYTTYMNSGDWIENLTALEYNNREWSIYTYEEKSKFMLRAVKNEEEDYLRDVDELGKLILSIQK